MEQLPSSPTQCCTRTAQHRLPPQTPNRKRGTRIKGWEGKESVAKTSTSTGKGQQSLSQMTEAAFGVCRGHACNPVSSTETPSPQTFLQFGGEHSPQPPISKHLSFEETTQERKAGPKPLLQGRQGKGTGTGTGRGTLAQLGTAAHPSSASFV